MAFSENTTNSTKGTIMSSDIANETALMMIRSANSLSKIVDILKDPNLDGDAINKALKAMNDLTAVIKRLQNLNPKYRA